LLSGSEKLIEVAKELGTPYYLEKPYRFEDLLTVLSKALREKSPPRYESIGKEKNAA
jgi:FixJ family two-component response regulator